MDHLYNKLYNKVCFLFSLLGLVGLLCFLPKSIEAQSFQTEFGKNRVQYHDFEWSFYESENFIVYFYQGAQDLAKFALKVSEIELENVENKLEHQLSDKTEIMVYHNVSDLRQTNIGQGIEWSNTGGTTEIVGNKIFVHFDGNHQNFRKQIIHGIAQVHFENMVFGSNLQEIIQNALLLNLPEWFSEGLIDYITEDWNTTLDDKLRKFAQEERFKKLNRLSGDEASFAGHSLWHYIAENYGESSIPNILYLTRINRSLDSGFLFVLGNPIEVIIEEWWEYVTQTAQLEGDLQNPTSEDILYQTKKRHKGCKVQNISLSPNGEHLVYATNDEGSIKVYYQNLQTKEKSKILKTGFKTYKLPLDHTYPILAWNERGNKLLVIYEKRDIIYLRIIDVATMEETEQPLTKFQQVLDADFTNDDRRLVLSAVQKGQADLFTYFIPNTRTLKLTDDFYDDIDIQFAVVDSIRGIVFRSNRPNDTLVDARFDSILPVEHFDIFFYDLDNSDQSLIQLTETPQTEEYQPQVYNQKYLSYLSDANGLINRYVVAFDTVFVRTDTIVYLEDSIQLENLTLLDSLQELDLVESIVYEDVYKKIGKSKPLTNYNTNIQKHSLALNNTLIELRENNGIYTIYRKNKTAEVDSIEVELKDTPYKSYLKRLSSVDSSSTVPLENPFTRQAAEEEEEVIFEEIDSLTNEFVDSIQTDSVELSEESEKIDIDNYFFQSEFDLFQIEEETVLEEEELSALEASQAAAENRKRILLSRVRAYAPRFSIDYLAAQLDNSILSFNQYQSYDLEPLGNFNPDLKALFRLGTTDLFEDYILIGGFRIPFSGLNHTEYFVNFRNLEKQLDRHWTFYRKAQTYDDPNSPRNNQTQTVDRLKNVTHFAQHTLAYPFDITSRLALHIGYRQDKKIYLGSTEYLNNESELSQWLQLKLEYVFDNTLKTGINLFNGTRFKLYSEFQKPFNATISDSKFDFSIKDTGWLGTIGGDFRHYHKIHRQIIWANRVSFATSIGSHKIVYFLGAVDNWLTLSGTQPDRLNSRFDYNTPVDQNGTANYAFQSLTPNLRGFKYNIRNGSSYVLLNSELRIPVFSYLINRPLKSQFLRSFQLVGFADAGTAWEVGNPFSEENRYFTYTYPEVNPNIPDNSNNPVTVSVRYFKNPIVLGYGFGVRASLLGYYLKLDRAWGLDSGRRNDGRWYLSLGLDF